MEKGQRLEDCNLVCVIDGVEEDLRKISVRVWRRRALDRDDWKKVLAVARAQTGL